MSDFPAPSPIPIINEEKETLNSPFMGEDKPNLNYYNNYPENIETTNLTNVISTTNYTKPDTSNPITYRSVCSLYPLIFIFAGLGFGIGFSYLCIKDDNIGAAIACNVFTLVGIGFIFCLKYSSMTIDINRGIISVKICKVYYCKTSTFNINDIEEINIRKSDYNGMKRADATWKFYDIVLIFPGGRRVIAATRSDENADATKVINTLRNILPQHIKIVNNLQPFWFNE